MITYNKLIRDRIPEIMAAQGKGFNLRTLSAEEFLPALHTKLGEELQEYLADGNLVELADLLEVIYAIAEAKGMSAKELEALRAEKKESRGGFANRLFLVTVDETGDQQS